ncbi:MAG: N-acetyltransferase [Pseudomonadota bacterium]
MTRQDKGSVGVIVEPVGLAAASLLARLHGEEEEGEAWSADAFAALLAQPAYGAHIAALTGSGTPAGFVVTLETEPNALDLVQLWTRPAHRRLGVARALLQAVFERAGAGGAVTLEVARDNEPALRLYRGAGFTQIGCRQGYYPRSQGRVDALVLHRSVELF